MENELNIKELRALVRKQQELLSQKDRQITHLSHNAQKWVQKFDAHQNNVAESVIKKFELEFERERNELHAKLLRVAELNRNLMKRLAVATAAAENSVATKDTQSPVGRSDDEHDISLMIEPATITELELSNEMIAQLEKYRD